MADSMLEFREIEIEGPPFEGTMRLWSAVVELGHPLKARSDPPLVKNHSIRLLVQRAEPEKFPVAGEAKVTFHSPLMLAAAVTPRNYHPPKQVATIRGAAFTPFLTKEMTGRYSDLRVVPASPWPPNQTGFNPNEPLAAPTMRATSGRIALGCARDYQSDDIKRLLSIDWGSSRDQTASILGNLRIQKTKTTEKLGRRPRIREAIAFDFVADGVELELQVPNPFGTSIGDLLELRVRLVAFHQLDKTVGLRLDLVGGHPAALAKLAEGLSWMARDLSRRRGCLLLQIDALAVPPLSWPLTFQNSPAGPIYTCGEPDEIPAVQLRAESVRIFVLSREDLGGGIAGTAELVSHNAKLKSRLEAKPVELEVTSNAKGAPASVDAPDVTLTWETSGGADKGLDPDAIKVTNFSGLVEVEPLARRLGRAWGASGAIAAGTRPPCAFIALERGYVQLPLPEKPLPAEPQRAVPVLSSSAFRGEIRFVLPDQAGSSPASLIGLGITMARVVTAKIQWEQPLDTTLKRTIEVIVDDAVGELDGALWAGAASPSPLEILPPRDSGPASLISVPIAFGQTGAKKNWTTEVDFASNKEIRFKLPLPDPDVNGFPLLVWQPHPRLALVSSVAMTRTAENSAVPSSTRELIPMEVTGTGDLVLSFKGGRLPRVSAAPKLIFFGRGTWRWPWPPLWAVSARPYLSSPQEEAGVAMASLTLPGVECTLAEGAATFKEALRVSLRYDLPLLDELFANAKEPESKSPVDANKPAAKDEASTKGTPKRELPPTALEPARLAGVWLANARRLARARTEADRVVSREQVVDGKNRIALFHLTEKNQNVVVQGLVEPYVWTPPVFEFASATNGMSAYLGAYRFKENDQDWYFGTKALRGLSDNFKIDAGKLVPDEKGIVKVSGFAVSSFAHPDSDHLRDTRGMALSREPEQKQNYTGRNIRLFSAPADQSLLLATLRKAEALTLGGSELQFWFRDLPLKKSGRNLSFDLSGGLETGLGPDPAALNRERLARSLYEWRMFQEDRRQYDFILAGPLAARPLRLLKVDLDANGTVTELQVLVTVQIADEPPKETQEKPSDGPFGPDNAYRTGNLLRLTFKRPTGGKLILDNCQRVKLDSGGAFVSSQKPLVVAGQANAHQGDQESLPITFEFKLKADRGGVDIIAAKLRTRLFGQTCDLESTDARFVDQALLASFKSPVVLDDVLRLSLLRLSWTAEELTFTIAKGRIVAPLNDAKDAPTAFTIDFEKQELRWFDVKKQATVSIDHEMGVVTISLDDDLAENQTLFRGFYLPAGRLRGTAALVFRSDGPSTTWPHPLLGSAFSEFAFDASRSSSPQRVTAIRHRHAASTPEDSKPDAAPQWTSRFMLDADFTASRMDISAMSWPVGCARISDTRPPTKVKTPGSISFDPDPNRKKDWTKYLVMHARDNGLVLRHQVRPRLSAHELPVAELLGIAIKAGGEEEFVLKKPWRFRALCDHVLEPFQGAWPTLEGTQQASEKLAWSSIDELCLVDMSELAAEAAIDCDPPGADERYAFMARYKGSDSEARIAGVIRRTLANAGFPVRTMLRAINDCHGGIESTPPDTLVLAGAVTTAVVTTESLQTVDEKADIGVTLTPQWILRWGARDEIMDLGPLTAIPQVDAAERIFEIAAYDAATGQPKPLHERRPFAFAAQDGTQSLIEGRLAAAMGVPTARVESTIAVDQAFLRYDGDEASAPGWLQRPLFVRTLLALDAVATAFAEFLKKEKPPRDFVQRISVVVPQSHQDVSEFRFAVTAWPQGVSPLDTPAPAVTLIVADERRVRTEILPAPLARTLVNPGDDELVSSSEQRASASLRALGLSANPRAVLLARVDETYLSIRGTEATTADGLRQALDVGPRIGSLAVGPSVGDAMLPPPHVHWLATQQKPAILMRRSRVLRRLEDTIYASPALGWPDFARGEELAKVQPRLGDEEVRRNEELAWAGRVHSTAWPAVAWDSGAEELSEAAFLSMGQRLAFRRRAARNLRSPSDRASVLVPPRTRAPTPGALQAAFAKARIQEDIDEKDVDPKDRAKLAPMLPGQIETTFTGWRPGVLLTQHEGVTLTYASLPFDKEFQRFGRPSSRGPVITRQLRTPRSSNLREEDALELRRRTFLMSEATQAPFYSRKSKLIDGPAVVLRYEHKENDLSILRGVIITPTRPENGWLTAEQWDGTIGLLVTGQPPVPTQVAAARVGLLQNAATKSKVQASLTVGSTRVVFDSMKWSTSADGMLLLFAVGSSKESFDAARNAVLVALSDATADTRVSFTMSGYAPMGPDDNDPAPPENGEISLDTDDAESLRAGPPSVLTLELGHAPMRERWLPLHTLTLAFGDPAYDRELGSPAKNDLRAFSDIPHVLALDRAEYDLTSTVFFAFWSRETPKNGQENPIAVPTGWAVAFELIPGDSTPARPLRLTATKAMDATDPPTPRYELGTAKAAYAIAISTLREGGGETARIAAGDRLRVSVLKVDNPNDFLSVDVGIVAEPVLAPPAATYGLATLHDGSSVGTALFATAPLPQRIEFPDLFHDLVAGHVRRRGLFLWPFTVTKSPAAKEPFAFLVKVDRTGGGQVPDKKDDFELVE